MEIASRAGRAAGILFALLLLAGFRWTAESLATPPSSRPNFLMIQVDDLSMKVLNLAIRERGKTAR